MNLVVGATGMLGGEICRLLGEQGKAVRALARSTSAQDKIDSLSRVRADVVRGDLKDPDSLRAVCRNVNSVVSTASSTQSRQGSDSIETVDHRGQLDLIDAAEDAGVQQFVLISFPSVELEFPLQTAKRAVEDRLRRGRMGYTILQPTCFMEVWLSAALGFDPQHGAATIYGDGTNRISWISYLDVAKFAVAALASPRAASAPTVKLGGPDALSPLQVVSIAEEAFNQKLTVQHVPAAALQAQLDGATDSLQKSFAGLMLYYARGDVIDMTQTARDFGITHLRSVRDYVRDLASTAATEVAR